MPIVSVTEIRDGRTGKGTYGHHRTYTRRFRVVTDRDTDGPLVATATPEIPPLGFPYITATEQDSLARVKEVTANQDEQDPRLWFVDVVYDTQFDPLSAGSGSGGAPGAGGGASPQNRPINPLDEPTRWRSSTVRTTKVVYKDKDNAVYKNSAGAPFSPPREVPKLLLQLTAVRNYASFTLAQQRTYWDKVNLGGWNGLNGDEVRVDGVDIEEAFERDVSFLRVTWTFLVDFDKWIPTSILDKGWWYLNGGVKTPFKDTEGNSIEGLLNGAGGDGGTTPSYLSFREYDRVSFAGIP